MKQITIILLALFVGTVIIPSLFVGYMNWDISYITTIGEWKSADRFVYGLSSILSGIGLIAIVNILEDL